MAKPQKSMTGGKGEIIESPITSNLKKAFRSRIFISTQSKERIS